MLQFAAFCSTLPVFWGVLVLVSLAHADFLTTDEYLARIDHGLLGLQQIKYNKAKDAWLEGSIATWNLDGELYSSSCILTEGFCRGNSAELLYDVNATLNNVTLVSSHAVIDANDWNDDGEIDLLVGFADGRLEFWPGQVEASLDPALSATATFPLTASWDKTGLTYARPHGADWDGDGDLDLILGTGQGVIRYWEQTGPQVWEERTGPANPFNGIEYGSEEVAGAASTVCSDSDNGATDAYGDPCASYTMYPGWCGTWYDDSDFISLQMCCACGGGQEVAISQAVGIRAQAIDFDHDGDLDLIVSANVKDCIKYFERVSDGLYHWGGKDGPFASIGVNYCYAYAVDWDLDGDVDVISASAIYGEANLWEQLRFDTFSSTTEISDVLDEIYDDSTQFFITSLDLDKDGLPDLLVGSEAKSMRVLHRHQTDSFTVQSGESSPFDGISLSVRTIPFAVDWDGDGDLDIVLGRDADSSAGTSADVALYLNEDGVVEFSSVLVSNLPNLTMPAVVDWDGDGNLDIILGEYEVMDSPTIRLFLGTGSGTVEEVVGSDSPFSGLVLPSGAGAPIVVDWDEDGDLDILLSGLCGDESAVVCTEDFGQSPEFDEDTWTLSSTSSTDPANTTGNSSANTSALGCKMLSTSYTDLSDSGNIWPINREKCMQLCRAAAASEGDACCEFYEGGGCQKTRTAAWPDDATSSTASAACFEIKAMWLERTDSDTMVPRLVKDENPFYQLQCGAKLGECTSRRCMMSYTDFFANGTEYIIGYGGNGKSAVMTKFTPSMLVTVYNVLSNDADEIDPLATLSVGQGYSHFTDFDKDGDMDAIVAGSSGSLTYYNRNYCTFGCSGRGVCAPLTGVCTCLGGYDGDFCNVCAKDYYGASPEETALSARMSCTKCPVTGDGVCGQRGWCSDDDAAQKVRREQGASNTSIVLAKGTGQCTCREHLNGTACSDAGCPMGMTLGVEDTDDTYAGLELYSCFDCSPGYFKDSISDDECQACEAGTVTNQRGTSQCEQCAAGRYMDITGSLVCYQCASGTVSEAGASACDVCGEGQYYDTSSGTCLECPAGKYNPSRGGTCIDCVLGTFSNTTGATTRDICKTCGTGVTTLETGSSSSDQCITPFDSNEATCESGRPCVVTDIQGQDLIMGEHRMGVFEGGCGSEAITVKTTNYQVGSGNGASDEEVWWVENNDTSISYGWETFTVEGGEYALCWCHQLNGQSCNNPTDFQVLAGWMYVIGPSLPEKVYLVLGRTYQSEGPLGGYALSATIDKLKLMTSCESGDFKRATESNTEGDVTWKISSSDSLLYSFGSDPLSLEPSTSYSICWCRVDDGYTCESEEDFKALAVDLAVEGPQLGQEYYCFVGQPCALLESVTFVGTHEGDRLTMQIACGDEDLTDGLPGKKYYQRLKEGSADDYHLTSDFALEVENTGDSNLWYASTGIFRLCFCRNDDPDNSTECETGPEYTVSFGLFLSKGPYVADIVECSIGADSCDLSLLRGVGLEVGDQLKIFQPHPDGTSTCHGVEDDVKSLDLPSDPVAGTKSGTGLAFAFGSVPSLGVPGTYRMCWRPNEREDDNAKFYAFAGLIYFGCPAGTYEASDADGRHFCSECTRGSYCLGGDSTTAATKTYCATSSTTVGRGAKVATDCLCNPGYTPDWENGYLICEACAVGKYQPNFTESPTCIACPTGNSNSATANLADCLCPEGEYDVDEAEEVFDCQPVAEATEAFSEYVSTRASATLGLMTGSLDMAVQEGATADDIAWMQYYLLISLADSLGVDIGAVDLSFVNSSAGRRLDTSARNAEWFKLHRQFEAQHDLKTLVTCVASSSEKRGAHCPSQELSRSLIQMVLDGGDNVTGKLESKLHHHLKTQSGKAPQRAEGAGRKLAASSLEVQYEVRAKNEAAAESLASTLNVGEVVSGFKDLMGDEYYYSTVASIIPKDNATIGSTQLDCADVGEGKAFPLGVDVTSLNDCQCSVGYTPSEENYETCIPCDIGTYKFDISSDACTQCSKMTCKSSECSSESLRLSTAVTGAMSADFCQCPSSYFSNGTKTTECYACGVDYYCPGGSSRVQCRLGSTTKGGTLAGENTDCTCDVADGSTGRSAGLDCSCLLGFYFLDDDGRLSCEACPAPGVVCGGGFLANDTWGVAAGTYTPPISKPGYFMVSFNKAEACDVHVDTVNACLGGFPFGTKENQCLEGHTGPLCGSCSPDWTRDQGGMAGGCTKCDDFASTPILLLFLNIDLMVKAAWALLLGKRSLESLSNLMKIDAIVLRIGMQWMAIASVLGQFQLDEIEVYGWSQDKINAEVTSRMSSGEEVSEEEKNSLLMFKYPGWFNDIWKALYAFAGSLPDVNVGTNQETLECLAIRHFGGGGTDDHANRTKYLLPLLWWLFYPLLLLFWLFIFCIILVKVIHPIFMRGVIAGRAKVKEWLVQNGAQPETVEENLTSKAIEHFCHKKHFMDRLQDPAELLGLVGAEVLAQVVAEKAWKNGAEEKLRSLNLNEPKEELIAMFTDVVGGVPDSKMADRIAEGKSKSNLMASEAASPSNEAAAEGENEDKLEAANAMQVIAKGFTKPAILVKVVRPWMILKQEVDKERAEAAKHPQQHLMVSVPEAAAVEHYGIFGCFRSYQLKDIVVDCVPFFLIAIYSIWDSITKRYLINLQAKSYYMTDLDTDQYRPFYIWIADPRLEVFSGDHLLIGLLASGGLFFWSFLFLFIIFNILRKNKDHLMTAQIFHTFGFFYNGLEPDYYYWEVVVKRMDVLIVYIVAYTQFVPDVKAKLIVYLALSGCVWVLHSGARPFDNRLAGMLDRLEYNSLRARFFTFAFVQLMLVSDAPKILNVVIAVTILSVNIQVLCAVVWSWLMEVFADDPSDESEEAQESVDGKTEEIADGVADKIPGMDDDGGDPITMCCKKIAKKAMQCGILQLALLIPILILSPFSRIRRKMEGTVPLFRWKGLGKGVDILTHKPTEMSRQMLFKVFGGAMRRFYSLTDESQRAFAAEVSGEIMDHLLTNAGFHSMPAGLLDFLFAFPTVLARAQEKFPPPEKITLPTLLAEAHNYVVEIYHAGYLGSYEEESPGFGPSPKKSQTSNSHEHDLTVSTEVPSLPAKISRRSSSTVDASYYEDREQTEHAVSAEQLNAGLLFLHRLPPAELHDLVGGFLETMYKTWCKMEMLASKQPHTADDDADEVDLPAVEAPSNPIRIPPSLALNRKLAQSPREDDAHLPSEAAEV